MSINAKKIAAVALVVMMAAGVAFAGDIAISIDARANLWTDKGFTITNGDDYLGQLMATYTGEKGGGFLRMRLNTKGQAPAVDRWQAWFQPFSFLKISLQTGPYEVYAESIRWEPIFAAGLFETGTPKLIVEIMPIDALNIMVGVDAGLQDAEKPWNTLAASVKYNISGIGSVAAEFAMLPTFTNDVLFNDGDAKKFGAQFELTMVESLSVLIGYTGVLVGGDAFDAANIIAESLHQTKLSAFAQNRIELFATYSMDKFAVALYEALILRSEGWGDMGNRVGVKASYQINDAFTAWLKVEHFLNYGGDRATTTGLAWGDAQLNGPNMYGTTGAKAASALVIQPQVDWNLGNGIGAYLGFKINWTMTENAQALAWAIPLGITVNF